MKKVKSLFQSAVLTAAAIIVSFNAYTQDVGKAAANVYILKTDTLGVRIYEIKWPIGAVAAMHTHPDHGIYVVDGGTLTITDKDGKTQEMTLKPGDTFMGGPETHTAKNTGTTALKAVVFEVRRPRPEMKK